MRLHELSHARRCARRSRAALLTGLNPHRAGFGFVANSDPGFPGCGMELADDVLTLPEILRDDGYATYAVGKWHLVRDADHERRPRPGLLADRSAGSTATTGCSKG